MDGSRTRKATRRLPVFALLSAGTVSEFGNVLTFVSVSWFVLETTGSAARTDPTGGPIVDRLGFKRTSVAVDLASRANVAAVERQTTLA
ncbi:MAG: hypothetical protein M3151_03390 [Actinomycetota bacterium]|nr:hypothetical protein [Actinomycetota bacterium]